MKGRLKWMVLMLWCVPVEAGIADTIKDWVAIFKEKVSSRIDSNKGNAIKLPTIPKINNKATDTDAFKDIETGKVRPTTQDEKRYNYFFVKELFEVTRLRQVSDQDLSLWLDRLNQGASREGVYRAVVLDNTYAALENYDKTMNPKLVEFTSYFHKIYLDQEVPNKAISQLNLFSIKRISVERALEVIDAFLGQKQNLFDWYAVLSSDLAETYPKAMNGTTRINSSREFHQKWASQVPLQYLKAEVIIKLHRAFNFVAAKSSEKKN